MPDVPFGARLALLLGLMALGAGLDRWRHGPAARRPGEYAFLLVAGAVGAAFGLACDQVTSRLSPDYFVEGKGLAPGPGFGRAVVVLSLQAGFTAGVVLGAALLLANQPRPGRPALPLARLLRRAAWPLGGALALAPLGALLLGRLDPLDLRGQVGFLPPARVDALVRVWGAHAGLYAGALLGLAAAALDVRRARVTEGTAPPPAP
ncbi:MAG: hypothetical protein M9894_27920 [Planctomycetes bacterium]|nr:hypothetical protein [Planctomycetota bacterium]